VSQNFSYLRVQQQTFGGFWSQLLARMIAIVKRSLPQQLLIEMLPVGNY
jgi:hypothetical protein